MPYERPSSIDFKLAEHPDAREPLEACAANPLKTIDQLFALAHKLGLECSRSSIGRWRLKFYRRRRGTLSLARQHLIIAVMAMTDRQLSEAIERLPAELSDVKSIRQPD